METNEVIKRNEKKFSRSRVLVKLILLILLVLIAILQYDHIINVLKGLVKNN
jgi:ABC-type lipoprotein release transport system permease subunit